MEWGWSLTAAGVVVVWGHSHCLPRDTHNTAQGPSAPSLLTGGGGGDSPLFTDQGEAAGAGAGAGSGDANGDDKPRGRGRPRKGAPRALAASSSSSGWTRVALRCVRACVRAGMVWVEETMIVVVYVWWLTSFFFNSSAGAARPAASSPAGP